ncbi:hypothetical protein HRI_003502200 [Hibiscus trionum]|uniref:RRM domain-containing protein n=1 Tax=Hibiscus trionum TaxID=183268 RepID=A0A9W7MFM0_HIBTR|nr:hypothetical protein HRI_003502200 [Hibiscus trionum]
MENGAGRSRAARSGAARGGVNHRHRQGVSVFIDNISRRIHRSALGVAFSGYGRVTDVFIAYKNKKRSHKPTTFAFIRFRNLADAKRAIAEGNGRRLDGFTIRIFMAYSKPPRNYEDLNQAKVKPSRFESKSRATNPFKLRDLRTYKEALLSYKGHPSNSGWQKGDSFSKVSDRSSAEKNVETCADGDRMVEVKLVSEYPPVIKEAMVDRSIQFRKELASWIHQSVVGRLKNMYNAEFVQDALRAEGFRVNVCPWEENMVVIRLSNAQERKTLWETRRELLRTWFDELELLEGFDGKHFSKCWVVLSNVPLQIWNSDFFFGLCNQWGVVIQIDDETKQLQRFDRARILVKTTSMSRIPDRVSVLFNGVIHQLVIKTEEFEEERVFIDGRRPGEEWEAVDADASFHVQDVCIGVEKGGNSRRNGCDSTSNDCVGAPSPRFATDDILCDSRREVYGARDQYSGSNLHEVEIISDANPPLNLGSGGRHVFDQRLEFGPAVSNGSQLHSVEIGLVVADKDNGEPLPSNFHPGISGPHAGSDKSKLGPTPPRNKSKLHK